MLTLAEKPPGRSWVIENMTPRSHHGGGGGRGGGGGCGGGGGGDGLGGKGGGTRMTPMLRSGSFRYVTTGGACHTSTHSCKLTV
eukprot:scaffold17859_cov54-Phaeocystis_antarctica.AAC.2